jgi:hypothetical protein
MNEQNEAYIKNNIRFLGFGDSLFPELMKNMENRFSEFVLNHERNYGPEKLEAKLYFKKSSVGDLYFVNAYMATLIKSNQEKISQMIYLDKGNGLTQKETYNLLSGRSVYTDLKNKEGERYHAWIKLDFLEKDPGGNYRMKQYHEGYKYDLISTLNKYPIRELRDELQKERLIQSLQRGNTQLVTFEKNGITEKRWIEANPQYKSLNVLDEQNRRVYIQLEEKSGVAEKPLAIAVQTVSPEGLQQTVQTESKTRETEKSEVPDPPKEKHSKRAKHAQKN